MKITVHFEFPLGEFWDDPDTNPLVYEALLTDAQCHLHSTVLDGVLHLIATFSHESED